MKKLFILFIALLLVPALYVPATAALNAHENQAVNERSGLYPILTIPIVHHGGGWKTSDRYEISNIEEYREVYYPEEPMIFYVEGSSEQLAVEEGNGFKVATKIFDRSINDGKRAKEVGNCIEAEYDPDRRAWQVKLPAPTDINDKYTLEVSLFCAKEKSACARLFGYGAQVNKFLPLQVR